MGGLHACPEGHDVSRKALYDKAALRLKRESGTVLKDPGGRTRICLVYPNTYSVGMSSLGFLSVYSMLNRRSDMFCERAFLPDRVDMGEHDRTRTPVFSVETGRPLQDFDIIAFSVSFENDFPNVLRVLELSGIPVRSSMRGARYPLVVMGGVCAFSNPEPLADFIDIAFVGEAEGMLEEFLDKCVSLEDRDELLVRALAIEGLYVPSFYEVEYAPEGTIKGRRALRGAPEKIRRRYAGNIWECPTTQLITTPEAEFSGMRLVEVQRGCPWSCRFCLAGKVFDPPRKKPLDVLVSEISGIRQEADPGTGQAAGTGSKIGPKIGLVGPSLGDYPHLADALRIDGVDFTITSLRASRASAELVKEMGGRKSVSIAPEAGTQRLRDHIGKKVRHGDILDAAGMLLEQGLERLRLYFMVGLPSETEEDIDAIVDLAAEIRGLSRKGKISLTLSSFVPKPFTDFEREPMAFSAVLKSRLRRLRDEIRRLGGVSMSHDPVREALKQGVLAQGDRRVGRALELFSSAGDYTRALKKAKLDPAFYIHRNKSKDELLPWDFISS
jgi:radical SAM superfamily enzyme YgiQ (UPF0313 family)